MELSISKSSSNSVREFCSRNLSYILNCLGSESQMIREFACLHFNGKQYIELFIDNICWRLEVRPYETAEALVKEGAPKYTFCFTLNWDGVEYTDDDVDDRDVNPYGIVVRHGLRLLRDYTDDIILGDDTINFAKSHGGLRVRFTSERQQLKQELEAATETGLKQPRSSQPIGKLSLAVQGVKDTTEPFEVILRRCLEAGGIIRTSAILICSGMDALTIETATQYPFKKSTDLMHLYLKLNS